MKEDEEVRSFIYELQPPLTPEQFFIRWNVKYLFISKNRENQFARIKRFFSEQTKNTADYKQVTKAFQDVFTTAIQVHFTYNDEMKQDIEIEQDRSYIGRQQPKNIKVEALILISIF